MGYKPKLANLAKRIPQGLRNRFTRGLYQVVVQYGEVPLNDSCRYLQASLRKHLFYTRYGMRLKKFKDIHKGQRCFIIGNGPSIRQQDLTKLKNETTFVVNWFALHEQYHEINPTYYCISAREFFKDGDARVCETNRRLHKLLDAKTEDAVKFFNYDSKRYVEDHNLLPGHQLYYLNHAHYSYVSQKGMSQDITREVRHGNTVIIDFCLHLALYMGFSEVYLLGCDCDLQYTTSAHSNSHFHPDNPEWGLYKKLAEEDDPKKHADSWYNNVIKDYAAVRKTFENCGKKVYNAGAGGKLEVFERVDYDRLFS